MVNICSPLANQEYVTIGDLKECPLALPGKEYDLHNFLIDKIHEHGIKEQIRFISSDSFNTALCINQNVAAGLYIWDKPRHFNSILHNIKCIPFKEKEMQWHYFGIKPIHEQLQAQEIRKLLPHFNN